MKSDSPRPWPNTKGSASFTLVEILVACAIVSILVVLLLSMTNQVAQVIGAAQARKSRDQAARIALGIIARDLEAATFPLVSTQQNGLQFVANPPALSAAQFNRDCIFWQAAVPGDTSSSDLSEVGYFVAWTTNPDGTPLAELRRFHVLASAANSIFNTPSSWLTTNTLAEYAPGSDGTGANRLQGLIAPNILGMWVTLYDQTNGIIYPRNATDSYDSRSTTVRPASAEIALVTIDSRAARQIQSASQITAKYSIYSTAAAFANSFTNSLLGQGMQVFEVHVPIHAAEATP